jgi:hypothetical protein
LEHRFFAALAASIAESVPELIWTSLAGRIASLGTALQGLDELVREQKSRSGLQKEESAELAGHPMKTETIKVSNTN